jgi:Fe-S-cluster containining protein
MKLIAWRAPRPVGIQPPPRSEISGSVDNRKMARKRWLRLYDEHAAEWDAEFRTEADRFGERIQCRRGCSMCCSQMFAILPLEAARVADAVRSLPAALRQRVVARARAYVEAARRMGLRGPHPGDPIRPRQRVRLPCPALEGDACTIYEGRPLICRKWGIPIYDPAKPNQLQSCELNFAPGESIPVGDLPERHTALLERWVALADEARDSLKLPGASVTVAEAILLAADE